MRTEQNETEPTSKIHVRASTRRKLDVIAAHKLWKLVEVVEQAAVALAQREGISLPGEAAGPRRSNRSKRPAAA